MTEVTERARTHTHTHTHTGFCGPWAVPEKVEIFFLMLIFCSKFCPLEVFVSYTVLQDHLEQNYSTAGHTISGRATWNQAWLSPPHHVVRESSALLDVGTGSRGRGSMLGMWATHSRHLFLLSGHAQAWPHCTYLFDDGALLCSLTLDSENIQKTWLSYKCSIWKVLSLQKSPTAS